MTEINMTWMMTVPMLIGAAIMVVVSIRKIRRGDLRKDCTPVPCILTGAIFGAMAGLLFDVVVAFLYSSITLII